MIEKLAVERGIDHLISVESSGTGAWHVGDDADPRMRRTAARHGLDLHHRARRTDQHDLEEADILLAMSPGHLNELRSMARRAGIDISRKLYLFRQFDPDLGAETDRLVDTGRAPEVPDPYYGGDEGFERVYRMVERSAAVLLDRIEAGRLP